LYIYHFNAVIWLFQPPVCLNKLIVLTYLFTY